MIIDTTINLFGFVKQDDKGKRGDNPKDSKKSFLII